MEKMTIDFETFNKLKEVAHDSVDDALRKIFKVCDDKGKELPQIVTKYIESSSQFKNLLTGELKEYKYKDNTNSNYQTNLDTDIGYPVTIYLDNKAKLWWLDAHNIAPHHPSHSKILAEKYGAKLLTGGNDDDDS